MNYKKIEGIILGDLELDIVPLHDVVRKFSGYERGPTDEEFYEAMNFLDQLLDREDVRMLEGNVSDNPLDMPKDEIIKMMKKKWEADEYEEINYGLWLDHYDKETGKWHEILPWKDDFPE